MSTLEPIVSAEERAAVVAEARSWLSTPFHHDAEVKGIGVDCAHLVLACYCGLGLVPRPAVAYYAVDWFLHHDRERFVEHVAPVCIPVMLPQRGDLALFQVGRATAHGAIVVELDPRRLIHADRGAGRVLEHTLASAPDSRQRLTGYWSLKRWHEAPA